MIDLRLQKLTIQNFKGVRDLTFTPDGGDASIFGTNAAGKTTVMDAFSWLLTGKDSLCSANFGIKPIGTAGKAPDITVEAMLSNGPQTITLKKVQAEKWTRKRGAATEDFTGNETAYFVNEVPVKLKGFDDKVKELVGGEMNLLRLLSNPRHFNEDLPWTERRKLLVEICGDVSDADVIATDPVKFARVPAMLNGKRPFEYKAELVYKRKGINDELRAIPVRIDESDKSLPAGITFETGPLTTEKAGIESRLSVLRNQLSMIESGGSAGAKKSELLDVQNKIREIEQGIRKKHDEEAARLRGVVRFCQEAYDGADKKIKVLKIDLAGMETKIASHAKAMADLTAKWHTENERQFSGSGVCPNCGQEIPAEKREEAIAEFNKAKADTLAKINADGKAIKIQKEDVEAQKAKLSDDVAGLEGKLPGLKEDFDNAKGAMEKHANTPCSFHPITPDHSVLLDRAFSIESEISEIALGNHDATAETYAQIKEQEDRMAEINKALAEVSAAEKTRARIEALTKDEKRLSKEFEALEADLFLMEDFTRAKCDLLTEQINRKFKIIRWSLFEDQINGGLKDICIATVGEVPYGDLNNAARINAGLDIINAMAKAYNVRLPVWVDNAESIVETLPTESQLIRLVVSAEDKTLRVDAESSNVAAKAA